MFIFHKTVDFCVLSISSLAECSNFFEEVVESVEVIAVRRVLAITRAVYKFAHKWHNGNDESYIYGVFNKYMNSILQKKVFNHHARQIRWKLLTGWKQIYNFLQLNWSVDIKPYRIFVITTQWTIIYEHVIRYYELHCSILVIDWNWEDIYSNLFVILSKYCCAILKVHRPPSNAL